MRKMSVKRLYFTINKFITDVISQLSLANNLFENGVCHIEVLKNNYKAFKKQQQNVMVRKKRRCDLVQCYCL